MIREELRKNADIRKSRAEMIHSTSGEIVSWFTGGNTFNRKKDDGNKSSRCVDFRM